MKDESEPAQHFETSSDSKESVDDIPFTGPQRQQAEKLLKRKLDMRLMAPLMVVYFMNYIDRISITSARLKGLEEDLGLTDAQYSTVLAIFFATYCSGQIPSNMFINRISRPSLFIGVSVTLWGLVSALTGITKNFSNIAVCRLCLGLVEAPFYSGAIYVMSRWYTRKELALRAALLYGCNTLSLGFGTLVAAGILGRMEGRLDIRAWRWLFYIEGAITMSLGTQVLWLLPDYPNNTRWLSPAERRLAQVRLAEDAGEADEDTQDDSAWKGFIAAISDPKVYLFSFIAFFDLLGMSFTNFFPTLTATLGFSTTITLLLAAPPWVLAAVICVANGYHADRTGERFLHVTFFWWMSILGYIIALSTMSIVGRYISLFFLASGHAGFVMISVWISNSITRPPTKRAASLGIAGTIGNLGNLVSSFLWKSKWGPKYEPSMIMGICMITTAIVLSLVVRTILVRANTQLQRYDDAQQTFISGEGSRDRIKEAARLEGLTMDEALSRKRKFRYLY